MPRHGKKFAMNAVEAIPGALDGKLLTDYYTAPNDNVYINLAAASTPAQTNVAIEGVTIKAIPADTDLAIYIIAEGKAAPGRGFPLFNHETISIAIDNLNKVIVFLPGAGDAVAYCAIEKARD